MRVTGIYAVLLTASLSLPAAAMAQTSAQPRATDPSSPATSDAAAGASQRPSSPLYGEGGSAHCDQLSAAEKQACLRDEGAKTDSKQEPAAAAPGSSAAGSSSSRDTAPDAKGGNATQTND